MRERRERVASAFVQGWTNSDRERLGGSDQEIAIGEDSRHLQRNSQQVLACRLFSYISGSRTRSRGASLRAQESMDGFLAAESGPSVCAQDARAPVGTPATSINNLAIGLPILTPALVDMPDCSFYDLAMSRECNN